MREPYSILFTRKLPLADFTAPHFRVQESDLFAARFPHFELSIAGETPAILALLYVSWPTLSRTPEACPVPLFYCYLAFHGHFSGFHGNRRSSLFHTSDLAVLADGRNLFVRRAVGQLLVTSLRGALCL